MKDAEIYRAAACDVSLDYVTYFRKAKTSSVVYSEHVAALLSGKQLTAHLAI